MKIKPPLFRPAAAAVDRAKWQYHRDFYVQPSRAHAWHKTGIEFSSFLLALQDEKWLPSRRTQRGTGHSTTWLDGNTADGLGTKI